MADEIDIAQARIDVELDRAITACKSAPQLPFTGICFNCQEKTDGHFCDSDCREDWEKRRRMSNMRFDSARWESSSD